MEQLFLLFTFFILSSTIMVITSINPIHSVFWMVLVFIYSAGLLISIGFDFLGIMLIIIYIGAITILFLFVIMMLDIVQLKQIYSINNILPLISLLIINILVESSWILFNGIVQYNNLLNWNLEKINNIMNIGISLYSEYAFIIIIISLLLLIAMIGAIVLTLELSPITKKQGLANQHQRNNSWI